MNMTAMDFVNEAKKTISEVSPETARDQLSHSLVLDVREPAEYHAGTLPGAINIPRGVLEFKIGNHPELQNQQSTPIIVFCLTGGRSALATEALNKMGYTHAVSMAGGFTAWQTQGFEISQP